MKTQLCHLTGLRGIAAYAVFFAHGTNLYIPHLIPGFQAEFLAYFALALFFVLSGFVITYNYADHFARLSYSHALYSFFVARFARLYPLYILFLLAGIPYLIEQNLLWTFLTLTQTWINKYNYAFPPAWSVSAECFFYLLFVAIIPGLNRVTSLKWTSWVTLLILVGSYWYLTWFFNHYKLLMRLADAYFGYVPGTNTWSWLQYYSPYAQFLSFLIGCMAAKLYQVTECYKVTEREARVGALLINVSAGIILVCFILSAFSLTTSRFFIFLAHQYLYSPFIAIILFAGSRYGGLLADLLSRPTLILMGDISYSVYFLQWSIFSFFHSGNKLIDFATATFFITAFSYGTFTLLEMPLRRFLRRLAILPSFRFAKT